MPIVNDVAGVADGIETEQRVERFAEILADEIVQREIETGARSRRNSGVQQRFEPIRIVGGERMRLEIGNDALDRFAVAFDRRRFADSFAAVARARERPPYARRSLRRARS